MEKIRWDILCVLLDNNNAESIQVFEKALSDGYEPFAVTPLMVKPKTEIISPQQSLVLEKIWMKKRVVREDNDIQ